jgi:hypothetical protein
MGEGGYRELEAFIVVIVTLGLFFFLVSVAPSQLISGSPENAKYRYETPESWEASELYYYAFTDNLSLNGVGLEKWLPLSGSFGGHRIELWNYGYSDKIEVYRQGSAWVFVWNIERFDFYNKAGENLGEELFNYMIDEEFVSTNSSRIKFVCKTQETSFDMIISYNRTIYTTPTEAWSNSEMNVVLGIFYDKVNTGYNSFNLMANLLFFQTPNIHPFLNVIIGLVFWIPIAYLIIVLISRFLPFT